MPRYNPVLQRLGSSLLSNGMRNSDHRFEWCASAVSSRAPFVLAPAACLHCMPAQRASSSCVRHAPTLRRCFPEALPQGCFYPLLCGAAGRERSSRPGQRTWRARLGTQSPSAALAGQRRSIKWCRHQPGRIVRLMWAAPLRYARNAEFYLLQRGLVACPVLP